MSEPKLISPMLDNFMMGDPIYDNKGVRCCPAMECDTNDKYMVKIVSVPASQTQVEALLLSGAYADKEAVAAYYSTLAEGVVKEAEVLQELSFLEGFISFTAWQTVPMGESETGYDVYLLSPYKRTLARQFRRQPMTHLGAVNLGLDLCSALAVCRKSGYMYINLKPDNIYLADNGSYQISDLGLMKLDSLKYASLPERYRSAYTAPEISDAFSALNTTMDIYAVGLILYQAYNDGNLPLMSNADPDAQLPPPVYADYEMSEIILKACAPDPEQRWSDPVEMGQALVAYMQRNGVNDTPITPVLPQEQQNDATTLLQAEETQSDDECLDADETQSEQCTDESTQVISEFDEEYNEDNILVYTEDADGNLSFLEDAWSDETLSAEETDRIDYDEVTNEVSDMLNHADDLIAHQIPDPVIQPEAIDVPIPEPIILEDESATSNVDDEKAEDEADIETENSTTEDSSNDEQEEAPVVPKKKHWIIRSILAACALLLIVAALFFYRHIYLQTIDSIYLYEGSNGSLTVQISTDVDENKLTVLCLDTYGNQLLSNVKDGKAEFTELAPDCAYKIKVQISGFHRLTGDTTASYTTPSQTNILHFNAATGNEDGSVILSFAVDGPDSKQWIISYLDDSKAEKDIVFSGHIVTLNGLTVGNSYTFTLRPVEHLRLSGANEVTHIASKIIKAEKVQITGCIDNVLTVSWVAPEKIAIKNWTVRCYNNDDFDQTIVTEQTTASFNIADQSKEYTVEVTAEGMSVSQRAFAAANSVTITDFKASTSDPNAMTLSWKPVGDISSEGWLLIYTIDGGSPKEITCTSKSSISISPVIPGTTYSITLQTADGKAILGGILEQVIPKAEEFNKYNVKAADMQFKMCKRPSASNWNRYYLSDSDYRTKFTVKEKASYLVKLEKTYKSSSDKITSLFVIRNSDGAIVSAKTKTQKWNDMWNRGYCELDIPSLPETPGKYTITIYFNGKLVNENTFTIVKK